MEGERRKMFFKPGKRMMEYFRNEERISEGLTFYYVLVKKKL